MRYELIANNIGVPRRDGKNATARRRGARIGTTVVVDATTATTTTTTTTTARVPLSHEHRTNAAADKTDGGNDVGDDDRRGGDSGGGSDEGADKYHGSRRDLFRSRAGGRKWMLSLAAAILCLQFIVAAIRTRAATRSRGVVAGKEDAAVDVASPKKGPKKSRAESIIDIIPSSTNNGDWSRCAKNPPKRNNRGRTAPDATESKLEPLWLPVYPSSLPRHAYEGFLAALTGVPKAAKSYYRSSPALKRCHSKNGDNKIQAITCEIVHPIVPCQRPHPSQQADQFGGKIIVAMRNPLTAFPAVQQEKAEAYHNQVGQLDREKWAEFRDEFVGTGPDATDSHMLKEWKNFIAEWRSMNPYAVETYMPWEYWTDAEMGPAMARRLSAALQSEGFPVLYNDEEVECLWHEHIYAPIVGEKEKRTVEGWYEPEYAPAQLEMIAADLEKFANEIKDAIENGTSEGGLRPGDPHLYEILLRYASEVRDAIG